MASRICVALACASLAWPVLQVAAALGSGHPAAGELAGGGGAPLPPPHAPAMRPTASLVQLSAGSTRPGIRRTGRARDRLVRQRFLRSQRPRGRVRGLLERSYFLRSQQCAICLGPRCDTTTPCEHRFHNHCLMKALEIDPRCAVCRRPICEQAIGSVTGEADVDALERRRLLRGLQIHADSDHHRHMCSMGLLGPLMDEQEPPEAVPQELWADRDFVLEAVRIDGKLIRFAPTFLADEDVALAAIECTGVPGVHGAAAFFYLADQLRDSKHVVLAAVRRDSPQLRHSPVLEAASERLRRDQAVVLAAVSARPKSLEYADPELQDDKNVVLEAAKGDVYSFEFASWRLRDDETIVRSATENAKHLEAYVVLKFATDRLRDNGDLVLWVLERYLGTMWLSRRLSSLASKRLWDQKDFVLQVVKRLPRGLEFASPRLRADQDVVLAATDAAGRLWTQRDRVFEGGCPLKYAHASLWANPTFVQQAVSLDPEASRYAP